MCNDHLVVRDKGVFPEGPTAASHIDLFAFQENKSLYCISRSCAPFRIQSKAQQQKILPLRFAERKKVFHFNLEIMPGFELWGAEERKEVNDVLETGILMRYGFDGPRKGIWKAIELEQEICKTFGSGYAQLTSSGTAALTTAMAALNIGYGDEVIMPTFTFVASFEAVLSVGAIPVLVDVDETLTLDPEAVKAAITPKTRCIMPVHMCGSMADMDALKQLCEEHDLVLIEDACQSIGGSYKGRKLGTIGDAGTFSFDFVKTITCGEGGVVMTNNEETYLKCDGYTDHGHDHKGADRGADHTPL